MFQIQTARLILRDFVEHDWPAVYTFSSDPAVTRFQTSLPAGTAEQTREWLRHAIFHNSRRPRTAYNLAIVRRGDAAVIGWIGAGRPRDSVLGDQDFGYALNRQSWGCGYATEALRALVAYLFEHGGARKISGECVGANPASARVMEKAGLQLEARWQVPAPASGQPEERLRYAIVRGEWLAQRNP